MPRWFFRFGTWSALLVPIGCVSPPSLQRGHLDPNVTELSSSKVVRASHAEKVPFQEPKATDERAKPTVTSTASEFTLQEFITLTVARNPRLAQVQWAVEAARGRAVQASLYPNPTLGVTGDELGDRQGPRGIWTIPQLQQEIVTANKLGLSTAVAIKEADQATLRVVSERYRVFTEVRQNYFEVAALQKRAEILDQLITLAEKSVENANKLLKAGEASELDVVQLEVDLERFRAELDAARRALPAAFRRLAASAGADELPSGKVRSDLEIPLPEYDLDQLRGFVIEKHPDLRAAQWGVDRARLALQRAEAEPMPNVTLGAGFIRQNQNRSNDWMISASIPVPVWNRNQGNIQTAKAQIGEAINEVGRVQNDLVGRLATAFSTYAGAKHRAERYRGSIIPKAERTYQLSLQAYRGGQFEYLRVLQAQRAVGEARLEYVRSLGEAWRAASEIAGFILEDRWPAEVVR